MRRRRLLVPSVLVLLAGTAGCATATTSKADFAAELASEQGISRPEADCVTEYVFAAYTDREIRTLEADGLGGLPSPRWAEYVHAMVGCTLGSELTGERR